MKINTNNPLQSIKHLASIPIDTISTKKHPCARLNSRWTRVLTSLDEFIDTYIADSDILLQLKKYESYLYDCAELLEVYAEIANETLNKTEYSTFKKETKKYRDEIGFIVNKIKHDEYELAPVTAKPKDETEKEIFGFALLKPSGQEVMDICDRTHPKGCAKSFNNHMLNTIRLLFNTDLLLDGFLQRSGIKKSKEKSNHSQLSSVLEKISCMVPIYFPSETAGAIVNKSRGAQYEITRKKLPMTGRSYKVSVQLKGDGYTKTFPLPKI